MGGMPKWVLIYSVGRPNDQFLGGMVGRTRRLPGSIVSSPRSGRYMLAIWIDLARYSPEQFALAEVDRVRWELRLKVKSFS